MCPVARCSKKCFKKSIELQLIIIEYSLKTKGNGTVLWWHGWSSMWHR